MGAQHMAFTRTVKCQSVRHGAANEFTPSFSRHLYPAQRGEHACWDALQSLGQVLDGEHALEHDANWGGLGAFAHKAT